MAYTCPSFVTVPSPSAAARELGPTIIWLRGELDVSSDGALSEAMARAIIDRPASIVLDLSEVHLISASALGVIIRARELIGQQSRSLTVRSPSPFVRRVIGICGLNELIEPGAGTRDATPEAAIGTLPGTRSAKRPAGSARLAQTA